MFLISTTSSMINHMLLWLRSGRARLSSRHPASVPWSVPDRKNQAKSKSFSYWEVKLKQSHIRECKCLPTLFDFQCACINELCFSSLKSISWTHSSYPMDLLLCAVLSLLRKEFISIRCFHILWASFATVLMWSLTLPSKHFLHKKYAISSVIHPSILWN